MAEHNAASGRTSEPGPKAKPAQSTAPARWRVVVGLGSNLPGHKGSPDGMIRAAAQQLTEIPGTTVLAASKIYATPPWGVVEQEEFRNAVVILHTNLDPLSLLHACQRIEADGGRVRTQHWGPRTVDLDLEAIYPRTSDGWAQEPLDSAGRWGEELILPHPYAHQRGFVLLPWATIAPGDALRGATVGELLAELPEAETRGITEVGPLGLERF